VTPRLLGGPTYQVMFDPHLREFLQRLNWPAARAGAACSRSWWLTLVYLSGGSPGGRERARDRGPSPRVVLRVWVALVFGF